MKTLKEIHKELISKEKSVREIVNESIEIIKSHEKRVNKDLDEAENINAILGLFSQEFIDEQVEKAQKMIDEGHANLFTGVPIILKDNILVCGEIISAGSRMLENYVATYDSSVVAKIKESGGIILARANMDEFAMGSSTENSAYGVVKNPIDTSRVPGGSSGGSAASVAYGAAPLSLGSDTGGSIRLPAAFCNLVGYKPSYGSVSRYGLMAMGSSLDQIGPFANTVEDAEAFFDLISFHDPKDATSLKDEFRNKEINLKKKIGIPKILKDESIRKGIEKEILEDFETQILKIKSAGYEVVDVDLPNIDKALAIYYVICPAEVSSNMGRYDGVRYGLSIPGKNTVENFTNSRTAGLGDEVRRRILLGTYILSAGYFDAFYNKAVIAREILKQEFQKAFVSVDAIMTPTASIFPWKFGEKSDPLAMYLADIFTVPANIIGSPSISIPTKKRENLSENILPIGIQLTGDILEDKKLFKIAKEIEAIIQK
ncbi:MAG: aspartyl-tRNA(Asn)/glutamyl-tRNA(Gln) amidotransferase subunit [Patescibacteria group bacterium]|nr:aspartyl-tRNA(Asn)/glutamyl-tRNA(Gln) amidotransferase subunit [Patescibacteria group bacterium]